MFCKQHTPFKNKTEDYSRNAGRSKTGYNFLRMISWQGAPPPTTLVRTMVSPVGVKGLRENTMMYVDCKTCVELFYFRDSDIVYKVKELYKM